MARRKFKITVQNTSTRGGYEQRFCLLGIAECVKCGRDVHLVDDTVEWTRIRRAPRRRPRYPMRPLRRRRRWQHAGFSGAPQGFCCGRLYVDALGDPMILDLEKASAR